LLNNINTIQIEKVTMNHFGHSGDLGDIIFALPTIRAMGGGVLHLYNHPGKTTFPMTQERVNAISPLLLQQPYIKGAIFAGDDLSRDTSINGFRHHCDRGRNLADAHLSTHGLPFLHRSRRWISVDSAENDNPVVFARTTRYHNRGFPWRRLVDEYGKNAVFLGTQEEFDVFASEFGHVQFKLTSTLLHAARVIAGAQLFIGNQSCLHAIAEGLKQNIILEVYPDQPNCLFNRIGVIDAWDDNFEFPKLPLEHVCNDIL
jgi:hypothetical protein